MSKPFRAEDDYVIIEKGKWIKFPTPDEAWEYYYDNKENGEMI